MLASIVLAGLVLEGCVTAGEYNRIKDQLAKANETIDLKDQRIEELDHELMVKQEEYLGMQDEIGRYRQNSEEADKLIAELRKQLDEVNKMPELSGGDGLEYYPLPGGDVGIRIADDILFDSGSHNIKPNGKNVLDALISQLNSIYPGKSIRIIGHTDTDPVVKTKEKYPRGNIQLSSERAISVFDYFKQKGVSDKRMFVVGCGPNKPLVPNTTPENKHRNRRVEIEVIEASK
jgi:chemotaxis protein MotB